MSQPIGSSGLRVFISYSHKDTPSMEVLETQLRGAGIDVLVDQHGITAGDGFTEEIQRLISYAHVFIALITEESNTKGWVQQEIGFALGLRIPVLPVALDVLPVGMIKQVKAWGFEDVIQADSTAALVNPITRLATKPIDFNVLSWRYVEDKHDRVKLLAEYARDVRDVERSAMVRQRAGLTSFQTPARPSRAYWTARHGVLSGNDEYEKLLRNERKELLAHAKKAGAKLIINPYGDYTAFGPHSRCCRLAGLIRSLETIDADNVYAVIDEDDRENSLRQSMAMVGDWFSATSSTVQIRRGRRQTVFCRHAPTVTRQVELFDEDFEERLDEVIELSQRDPATRAAQSKSLAIARLRDLWEKERRSNVEADTPCPDER